MKERLDRALVNEEWMNKFPEAALSHFGYAKSYHRPLLMNT